MINSFHTTEQVPQGTSGESENLSLLQKFAKQHKIEKKAGIKALSRLIHLVGLIGGAILFPAMAIPIALYNLKVCLTEKYKISFRPNSVLAVIRNMKKTEEMDKFQTMQRVRVERLGDSETLSATIGSQTLTVGIQDALKDPALEKNRGVRQLLRVLAQEEALGNGDFDIRWIEALKDPAILKTLNFDGTEQTDFAKAVAEHYPGLEKDLASLKWNELTRKIQQRTIPEEKVEEEVKKFETLLKELLQALDNPKAGQDPTSANREVIAALRKALSHPVYQALKEDPSQQSVQFLHHLASAIWNKAPSMDAYRDVGASIIEHTSIQLDQGEREVGEVLAEELKESHEEMQKLHYTVHGLLGMIKYAVTHFQQTIGGLASAGGIARDIAEIIPGDRRYDSHGKLSNNPSLQGVTTVTLQVKEGLLKEGEERQTQEIRIHNCYGGSPTIGDHETALEFEAVLQAAENNQLAPKKLQDKDLPMVVNYNNLQNLHKKHGEGPRTRAIMLLNKKYPLSFIGTTFSKDSDFYLMKTSESLVWDDDPSNFGKIMRGHFERSFDPKETGHGFYFRGSLNKWNPIFDKVFANANHHFNELKKNSERWNALTPQELQGAYQEYIYSSLNAIIELESIKILRARGIDMDKCIVMIITACKENIDRGGMENTKYLYLKLNPENLLPKLTRREKDQVVRRILRLTKKRGHDGDQKVDLASLVDKLRSQDQDWLTQLSPSEKNLLVQLIQLMLIAGVMHSRALSSRDRVILESRMPQILAFMKTTSPEDFKKGIDAFFGEYGVTRSEYSPYLKSTSQATETIEESIPIPL